MSAEGGDINVSSETGNKEASLSAGASFMSHSDGGWKFYLQAVFNLTPVTASAVQYQRVTDLLLYLFYFCFIFV